MSLNIEKLNFSVMFVEFEGEGFYCHTPYFLACWEVFWSVTAAWSFESGS